MPHELTQYADEGKCDCGYFLTFHLPCHHVLAACSHVTMQDLSRRFMCMHLVYRMGTVFKVYRMEFRPIRHEDDWPTYDSPRIRPNS
ncbi:hypothetical protein Ahy_A08g038767 [Arachis hypogaea]|uniref:SWIM-type domain-containing protein n=1 Tax=Arachis hypogaea TaxID=3818 RepID=A0A445BUB7_ARAHY|nr:hypothetical protein Ahy_A08g038767 [Arachis hypogaea]